MIFHDGNIIDINSVFSKNSKQAKIAKLISESNFIKISATKKIAKNCVVCTHVPSSVW